MDWTYCWKQTLHTLRTERTYAAVFILGTAFSLALVTVFLTLLSMTLADGYPERFRRRTAVVERVFQKEKSGSVMAAGISGRFADDFLKDLPGVETVVSIAPNYGNRIPVVPEGGEECDLAVSYFRDTVLWQVFRFDFLSGGPVGSLGLDPAAPEIVVSESAARQLFGHPDVLGKYIGIRGRDCRIVGVYRDVPPTSVLSCADIWGPAALLPPLPPVFGNYLGPYLQCVLLQRRGDAEEARKALAERIERYGKTNPDGTELYIPEGRMLMPVSLFVGADDPAYRLMGIAGVLLVLLVPVLNLSGMAASRMEARYEEFGIRKSFGADTPALFGQIVGENLFFTLAGALLGLAAGWAMLMLAADRLCELLPSIDGLYAGASFPVREYFRLDVFLVLTGAALVLNLLSALWPFRLVVRRPVTEMLNTKR